MVAPSQGRGLKRGLLGGQWKILCRPLTGARIETRPFVAMYAARAVAPSQGRGLKHIMTLGAAFGLRRPLTGARIET